MKKGEIHKNKCCIGGKVCSLIKDGGSCTNVVGTRLVTKMNLKTIPHPRPYKLQQLSEEGELEMQVEIVFSIGKYKDNLI